MSMVLRFKPQARSGAERALRQERPCEIVIFPGVRIERHTEPESGNQDDALFEADAPVPRRG
jgi:hypothetical protein